MILLLVKDRYEIHYLKFYYNSTLGVLVLVAILQYFANKMVDSIYRLVYQNRDRFYKAKDIWKSI